jgi:hypothetical protein
MNESLSETLCSEEMRRCEVVDVAEKEADSMDM